MGVLEGLAQIRSEMDKHVVGHDDVKEAILLGVIAREHIYLEGPPGTAKTMLAEITSEAADLQFFFYQLHRDTRLAELVGDTVIFRERDTSGGEVIRQMNRKGGILTSEICVLDDISRSPGEALNVLLRVLNERKFGGERIPLLTAIATGNPTKDDSYYNEPLDPANLDRFTIQMRTLGLLQRNSWEEAARVVDLYAHNPLSREIEHKVDRTVLDGANTLLPKVDLTPAVKQLLLEFLNVLLNDYGLTDKNSLLTDRTFLVKAVKILKAKAVLERRDYCVPEDLFVLKYLTTFRIPEELHKRIEDIINDLLRKKKLAPEESEDVEQMTQAKAEEQAEGQPRTDYTSQEATVDHRKQKLELGDMMQQTLSPNADDDGDSTELNLDRESIENIEALLKVLKGRIERNRAEKIPHRGGQPRKWRRLSTFDDLDDTDPVESSIWYDHLNPQLPRMLLRERFDRGGELAILRDISSSMAGVYSKWASSVILRLVELAKRKRMRVGYIEFNHLSTKYQVGGKFFVRDYDKMSHRALNLHCSGCTNYQNSLEDALLEFKRLGPGNQHILFLTDGVPTQGDWEVKTERELAKDLGVAIHTIFIGKNKCPRILEIISEETEGAQFQASTDRYGIIRIEERNQPASLISATAGEKGWL